MMTPGKLRRKHRRARKLLVAYRQREVDERVRVMLDRQRIEEPVPGLHR